MKHWFLGVFVLSIFSCAQQESKQPNTPIYFDVEGYFASEINRLQKINPIVIKEVIAKGKSEQKSIKIADWKIEIASFSNADINKSSWQGEFTEAITGNNISYTTNNPKIPIKRIEIIKTDNKIKAIQIFKLNENSLYTSTDTLLYFPDSLYLVQSQQKIKLLSLKKYQVVGKLK